MEKISGRTGIDVDNYNKVIKDIAGCTLIEAERIGVDLHHTVFRLTLDELGEWQADLRYMVIPEIYAQIYAGDGKKVPEKTLNKIEGMSANDLFRIWLAYVFNQ